MASLLAAIIGRLLDTTQEKTDGRAPIKPDRLVATGAIMLYSVMLCIYAA
jgi:hypothetical protein